MQSIAKQNERIKMGKAEIETAPGERLKNVNLHELEEEKLNKGLAGKLSIKT